MDFRNLTLERRDGVATITLNRPDAFNALNRVNLSDPVTDLSNSNFGKVTSQLNTRAIQLGARLRF